MSLYKDNTMSYPSTLVERTRADEAYRPFTAMVLTVDYERKVLTLLDDNTRLVYQEVRIWPSNASANESDDVNMPEPGTKCLAVNLTYSQGFCEVAVVSWILTGTLGTVDAVATRGPEGVQGWTQRRRGTYRKAYPGQKTMTTTSGYSEKIDEGWDYLASDFSRDKVDVLRRERTQITSRNIRYSDAGLNFEGPVSRSSTGLQDSGALNLAYQPTLLPDGTEQFTLFLNAGTAPQDRYIDGEKDVIALSERVEKIQEFALDYPVPEEVLEESLLDIILGTTQIPGVPGAGQRTTINEANTSVNGQVVQVGYDSESFLVNQAWDNPQSRTASAVGPTTGEGVTPARRGFIIERSEGTFVGSNLFDAATYGFALKPVLTSLTTNAAINGGGRFGADFESGYMPVITDTQDNVETRMAASVAVTRFPYEYNTTRWDVTKEGMLLFEVGTSIPKENVPFAGGYEYPHGAGRSVEGHFVGSMKLVVGKNRDEEDAIDIQALGQSVLRFGADDTSLPNDRRTVLTQNRSQGDNVIPRTFQYWSLSGRKLTTLGDPVSLTNKTAGENVSIRAATDGGVVFRFGARTPLALRRHLINGYADAQGRQYLSPNQPAVAGKPVRIDSKSPGRPTYQAGDVNYQFHDLTAAGAPLTPLDRSGNPLVAYPGQAIYGYSGAPITSMDAHGLSIDFHTVRDILIRAGKDAVDGQSLLMDLAGGLVAYIGEDVKGRSLVATLQGGVELSIGANKQGNGLQLNIEGNVNMTVHGNYNVNVTGDYSVEANSISEISHTDTVRKAQKVVNMALARITNEAPDIVNNQGLYASNANS